MSLQSDGERHILNLKFQVKDIRIYLSDRNTYFFHDLHRNKLICSQMYSCFWSFINPGNSLFEPCLSLSFFLSCVTEKLHICITLAFSFEPTFLWHFLVCYILFINYKAISILVISFNPEVTRFCHM